MSLTHMHVVDCCKRNIFRLRVYSCEDIRHLWRWRISIRPTRCRNHKSGGIRMNVGTGHAIKLQMWVGVFVNAEIADFKSAPNVQNVQMFRRELRQKWSRSTILGQDVGIYILFLDSDENTEWICIECSPLKREIIIRNSDDSGCDRAAANHT